MQNSNHSFFDELLIIFSKERLHGYLHHLKCNNKGDALIAYSWNIELSQSLYPSLQILEIALRNSLHQALSENFNTTHWFDLSFLHVREKKQIELAKKDLRKENKQINADQVIAKMSFEFWTSLFDVRYEHQQVLWPKLLKPTFPFLAKSKRTRSFISRELNLIRYLRNRIFHHEPIWHWKDLIEQHSSIEHMISSLSPFASQYLHIFDQFQSVYFDGQEQIKTKINQKLNVH